MHCNETIDRSVRSVLIRTRGVGVIPRIISSVALCAFRFGVMIDVCLRLRTLDTTTRVAAGMYHDCERKHLLG